MALNNDKLTKGHMHTQIARKGAGKNLYLSVITVIKEYIDVLKKDDKK